MALTPLFITAAGAGLCATAGYLVYRSEKKAFGKMHDDKDTLLSYTIIPGVLGAMIFGGLAMEAEFQNETVLPTQNELTISSPE